MFPTRPPGGALMKERPKRKSTLTAVSRNKMTSSVTLNTALRVSKAWIALKRLDKNDDRVVALREVFISPGAELATVVQIFKTTFRLSSPNLILKLRNHCGFLIPLNGSIPANTKHKPYVLEVTKTFQHVSAMPRTIPITVINKSMKTRLQTIDRRIQRLEELLPDIKLKYNEKLDQEIGCLTQKLHFLQKRMQIADSHSWKGMLTKAPLW